MWNRFLKLLWQVFNYHKDLQAQKETTKQQGLQIQELADALKRYQHETQLQRERDAREFERAIHHLELALRDRSESELWRENQRLRERLERMEQRSLPPPSDKKPDGE